MSKFPCLATVPQTYQLCSFGLKRNWEAVFDFSVIVQHFTANSLSDFDCVTEFGVTNVLKEPMKQEDFRNLLNMLFHHTHTDKRLLIDISPWSGYLKEFNLSKLNLKWAVDYFDTEMSECFHSLVFSSPVGGGWPITSSTWIPPGRDPEAFVWTEECCGWTLQDDTNTRCWLWCNKYHSNWWIFSFVNKWSRFRSDAWKGEYSWAATLVLSQHSTFRLEGGIKTWDTQNSIHNLQLPFNYMSRKEDV